MKLSKILTIYKKELLDVFRDKRTILTSIILPIIIYPIFMVGFSSIMSRQEMKVEEKGAIIYIDDSINNDFSRVIKDSLSHIKNFDINSDNENYENLFQEKKIHAIIRIYKNPDGKDFDRYFVKIIYDASEDEGKLALDKVTEKLKQVETALIKVRLEALNVSSEVLDVIDIEKENVASKEKMFGFFIGKILPYFLIMLIISGGAVVASDLVAGEKERKTLETLLVSAAGRNEIVIGKYLTIITLSLITLLLNLISIYLSMKQMIAQASQGQIAGFQMPILNFALVFLAMLPLITFFAAILLSISTYSRNMKEANTYLSPIMMFAMMFALISALPGIELNIGLCLIPVINFSLLFKDIMMNNFNLLYFLVTIGSTLILDAIAIFISIKLFNKETVLFRVEEEKSLKIWDKKNYKNVFSEGFVILFFIIQILLMFYVGSKWQASDIVKGLFKTQIVFFLLPVLIILQISKQDFKKVLRLNLPSGKHFILTILMVVPMFFISNAIMTLTNMIYPIPESYMEIFEKILGKGNLSFQTAFLTIAVLPAICEEIAFRGYIINGFNIKKYGILGASIISGIMFGIMHLDPFRLLPTTILGILLGYILLKSNSIYLTMLFHLLNNGLAVILSQDIIPSKFTNFISDGENIKLWLILPSLLILFVILWYFNRENKSEIFLQKE